MSFSEFITHPNRYTNLFNTTQTTQILSPQPRKKNSETDPAQQKQRKQIISADSENILAWCLQPIQRLQPNFTTDGIINFIAQQKQRKQLSLIDEKNIFAYCFQPM